MKKIFIIFFITSFTLSSFSQKLSVPKYGIKIGGNYSSINFPQYNYTFLGIIKKEEGYGEPSTKNIPGFNAGLFIDIRMSDNWYISPTISYNQIGAETNINKVFDNDTIRENAEEISTYKLSYIRFDPYFEYRITLKDKNNLPSKTLSLNIGPSIGYLISNNINIDINPDVLGSNQDYNGTIDGISSIDLGLNIGGSFFLTENIDCSLMLYMGITELMNEDVYYKSVESTSLSIGYTF